MSFTPPRGSLLPVFRTTETHGAKYAQVSALNLDTGRSELGWMEINSADLSPLESYPSDSELLQLIGAPYLDDFVAKHTVTARFLMRQSTGPASLLCYVVTASLSMAKLVIFTPREGKFSPGEPLSIPMTEIRGGISALEMRDLLGDGSDCVITQEPFREQAETLGVNLHLRNVVEGELQELWQAPLKYRNFSQYNPKVQILQPPEQNIGAPGTVTTGEVSFRPSGTGQTPIWKGKVEFFVFGREKAVDSVSIEKACPWNGKKFAPLR